MIKLFKLFKSVSKDPFGSDFALIEEMVELIESFGIEEFWELGSFKGHSSDFMKTILPKIKVFSCDILSSHIEEAKRNNSLVDYRLLTSVDFLKKMIDNFSSIPFIFLDAHGTYGGEHEYYFPLPEELDIIGNSEKPFILCVHDCKIAGKPIFSYDTYDGIDISTELIDSLLAKTKCDYTLYIPSRDFITSVGGRCYCLINTPPEYVDKMTKILFSRVK
jgi:hypothetical protein